MKRSKLNKVSKQPISRLQRKIWQECRRIALKTHQNALGQVDCYTCGATNLQGANRQLGHGPWPKASLGAFLKYDYKRVLRWQCARCNLFMGGMGAEFYKRLKEELGDEAFAQLEQDRNKSVKAYDFYTQLLAAYSLL